MDTAEGFFGRHGGKVVTVARFVEGLRQANGIVAGVSKMRWTRFLMFNLLGAALWCGEWITVGDLAGSHIDVLYRQFKQYEVYVAIGIGLLVLAFIARKLYRHRRDSHNDQPG